VLLRDHPETFEPSAGAWGRQGCTNVKLATADRRAVRGAARLAWDGVMTARPPRLRKATPGASRPKPRTPARKRTG
jgi:hypothetical protein